jgi:hypothetical protein
MRPTAFSSQGLCLPLGSLRARLQSAWVESGHSAAALATASACMLNGHLPLQRLVEIRVAARAYVRPSALTRAGAALMLVKTRKSVGSGVAVVLLLASR